MNIGLYEIALIGVGGTIIGALLGAWITYRFALKLSIINNRQEANRKFLSAFHNVLSEIYPTPVSWPDDIDYFLRERFSLLQAAIGEFRHYLPTEEWDDFDKAWFKYYCSTEREIDKDCQVYHHYMPFKGESIINGKKITEDNTQTYKNNFKNNVEQLLRFAKKT